jgi:hypothetical protein
MTHRLDDDTHGEAAGERLQHAARHPLRSTEHEVEKLKEIAETGESAATPVILTVTWIAIVLPLVAIVVALAFGAAYLVTGSTGTRYPAGPAGTQPQTTTQTSSATGRLTARSATRSASANEAVRAIPSHQAGR